MLSFGIYHDFYIFPSDYLAFIVITNDAPEPSSAVQVSLYVPFFEGVNFVIP